MVTQQRPGELAIGHVLSMPGSKSWKSDGAWRRTATMPQETGMFNIFARRLLEFARVFAGAVRGILP